MNINLEFDEAEIIKDCLTGLKKDDIRKRIISKVVERVSEQVAGQLLKQKISLDKNETNTAISQVKELLKKEVIGELKTFLKKDFDNQSMREKVEDYLYEMIEGYFEYSPVSIEFSIGKNKKIVDVLGTRKK